MREGLVFRVRVRLWWRVRYSLRILLHLKLGLVCIVRVRALLRVRVTFCVGEDVVSVRVSFRMKL